MPIFYLLPVPSSPPTNVTVHSVTSTSLLVSWNPVPAGHANGIITGYKVFYVDREEYGPKVHLNVSSTALSVELSSLLVYTNYCIQVLAFTREGDGNLSDCVISSTGEGGKILAHDGS